MPSKIEHIYILKEGGVTSAKTLLKVVGSNISSQSEIVSVLLLLIALSRMWQLPPPPPPSCVPVFTRNIDPLFQASTCIALWVHYFMAVSMVQKHIDSDFFSVCLYLQSLLEVYRMHTIECDSTVGCCFCIESLQLIGLTGKDQ